MNINYQNKAHKCTYIGCEFGAKETTSNINNAHALMFLHARKVHTTRINFACHKNCDYISG